MTNRSLGSVAAGATILLAGGVIGFSDARGEARRDPTFTGTVQCSGSVALLRFSPTQVEARVRGDALAQANTAGRGFDYRVCKKTKTQRGWFTGIRYKWLKVAAVVTCRFPGQFSVHMGPVSPSWAGERPAGSAVYLVLNRRAKPGPGPKRTIVASASVIEHPKESRLAFAPRFCRRSEPDA